MTEDEMVGWPHQLNGHEFKQTLGDGEGQGSVACCSPWGYRVGYNLGTDQSDLSEVQGTLKSLLQHDRQKYQFFCT